MSYEWQEYMHAENARRIADLEEQLAAERAKVANIDRIEKLIEGHSSLLCDLLEMVSALATPQSTDAQAENPEVVELRAKVAQLECQLTRLADCGDWALCDVRRVARQALAALQSTDALADIRREVARECAEIAKHLAATQFAELDAHAIACFDVAAVICAKFGVTE